MLSEFPLRRLNSVRVSQQALKIVYKTLLRRDKAMSILTDSALLLILRLWPLGDPQGGFWQPWLFSRFVILYTEKNAPLNFPVLFRVLFPSLFYILNALNLYIYFREWKSFLYFGRNKTVFILFCLIEKCSSLLFEPISYQPKSQLY